MDSYLGDAVIYARVSTQDKQDNQSQIDELKRLANEKNLNVVMIFEEKVSGTIPASKRPEFIALVKYIAENEISHILVSELSRLGRNMMDTISVIKSFSDNKRCIHFAKDRMVTLNEDFTENKYTAIIISILSGFADMEKDYIRTRSIRGLRYNVEHGGSGAGIIKPYGYKKEGKKLIIDDVEAEVVKRIFELYNTGTSCQGIANLLNLEGVKTKYNTIFDENKAFVTKRGRRKLAKDYKWRDATIINILKNTIYYGDRKHKGEVYYIPPIITKEIFEFAQINRKEKNSKIGNSIKHLNIFKGKIICPICGSGYMVHKRQNGKDNAYVCVSSKYKDINCNNPSLNIDKLNNAVYAVIAPTFKIQAIIDKKLSSKSGILSMEMDLLSQELGGLNNLLETERIKMLNLDISIVSNIIEKSSYLPIKQMINEDMERIGKKIAQNRALYEEKSRIINAISEPTERNLENVDLFKAYIKDYLTYIKLYDISDLAKMGLIGNIFEVKNDIIILVELRIELIDTYKTFVVSRYSKKLVNLNLINCEELEKRIPYITDYTVETIDYHVKI